METPYLQLDQELLRRVEELTEDCRQAKFDHARESHFNREVQLREVQLQEELRKYRSVMVRNLTTIVLTPSSSRRPILRTNMDPES